MGFQEGALRLPIGGMLLHLICIISLFAPILIKSCSAEYAALQGKDPCSLCPNGDEFEFPEAPVPFFVLPGAQAPTCSDLSFVASMVPLNSIICAKYQENAGYCGCPEVEPLNYCSFCPNGDIPARSDFLLPTGETCNSLHTYVSFFNEDQCTSLQHDVIATHANECGCEVSSKFRQAPGICTLCPDGSSPPDEELFLDLAGLTCGEYAAFINTLNPAQCEIQSSRGTFDLFAFQCNCPGTSPPVCPRQENPELCTVSLLNTVDDNELCECYSFCDEKFVGCDTYPGNFMGDKCPQTSVSGCNYASAIDDLLGITETDIEDSGSCSICPNFTNDISNPDAILPPFSGLILPGAPEQPTCQDLVDYLSKQSDEDGDCQVAKNRLAHYCGCDDVEPSCTLCPGGIQPSYTNKIATGETTCEDFSGTVLTWESGTCEIGESYLSVMAARCGCITAEWPVCPVRQNPLLCTTNLLRSATNEDCECHNFCGDQFHSCAEYPGQILDASDCPEGAEPIAGCNHALATSQRCRRGSIGPPCDDVNAIVQRNLRHRRH